VIFSQPSSVPSSDDAFPLGTAEGVLLDGPNGVTGAPRQHFPDAVSSGAAAVVALVVALVVLRRGGGRRALALLLALVTLPGLFVVLVRRADAPLRRPALASQVQSTLAELLPVAGWPDHPATVTREDDDVLHPLLRYALPSRAAGGATKLEVRGSKLTAGCVRDGDTVVCGVGP
jgi:hypothetical protein